MKLDKAIKQTLVSLIALPHFLSSHLCFVPLTKGWKDVRVGREENGINTKQEFCRGSPLVPPPFIPLSACEESICH